MKLKTTSERFGFGYLLFAALLIVLGICLIAYENVLENAALAIGICLSVFAIVYAVLALADKNRGVAFFLKITFAVMALTSGIVTIVTRAGAIEVIVTVFSLILLIDGAFKFQTTVLTKRIRSPFWVAMLVLAVAVIGGAFAMIKFYPSDKPRLIALGTAAVLIVDGAANLLTPFFLRAIANASAAPAEEVPAEPDPTPAPIESDEPVPAAEAPAEPAPAEEPKKKRGLFGKKKN